MKANFMDHVYNLHKEMLDQQLTLVYEGEVTQSITKAFTAMTEKQLERYDDSTKTKRRLYHVMVECLQNIGKHAEDQNEVVEEGFSGSGIFLVGTHDNYYSVTTGNSVAKDKEGEIASFLDKINSMSPEEVKTKHREMMKASRLSDKAGAGLGLIDIVKKTGNTLECQFKKIDDESSFMILTSKINRD